MLKKVFILAGLLLFIDQAKPLELIGTTNADSITFGLLSLTSLSQDTTIGSSDRNWVFPNIGTIDGMGHWLTLAKYQAIKVTSGATLTIKNCTIVAAARDCLCATSDASSIILDNCTLILGFEGLGWKQGNIVIKNLVGITGYSKPFFADPSGAELISRAQDIGFGLITGYASTSLYSLDFCGPTDERAGITIGRVDQTGTAYFSDSIIPDTPSWTAVSGGAVYKSISIGTDGTIWVVGNNRTVYRNRLHKDIAVSLTAATNITADKVSVGNRFQVHALNSSTGAVYKCSDPDRGFSSGSLVNPLTGAPQTWVQVSGVNAKDIATGTDGCLWYINQTGQVFCRDSVGNETLIHDGSGYNFVKVSAKGTTSRYSIILTCSSTNRAVYSYDGCAFKDLGLANIQEAATDLDGNILLTFQSSKVSTDPTYGAPLYYRHSMCEMPVLCTDKTLTFSASAGANLAILSGSTLALGSETTLRLNADCDFSQTSYQARRHFVFTDQSSTLALNRASLEAVCAGLTLTTGTIEVQGTCQLKPSTWLNSHTEISSTVKINIRSGGNLQPFGRVDYCAPSRLASEITPVYYGDSSLVLDASSSLRTWDNLNRSFIAIENKGFALLGSTSTTPAITNLGWVDRAVDYTGTVYTGLSLVSPTKGIINVFSSSQRELTLNSSDPSLITSTTALTTNFGDIYSVPASRMVPGYDGTCGLIASGSLSRYINPTTVDNTLTLPTSATGNGYNITSFQTLCAYENLSTQYRVVSVPGVDPYIIKYSSSTWTTLPISKNFRMTCALSGGHLAFLDNYGNLKIYQSNGTIKNVTNVRGLDLIFIEISGTLQNYQIIAIDRYNNLYSADQTRPFAKEFWAQAYWANIARPTQTGLIGISNFVPHSLSLTISPSYIGYIKGCAPSSWPYPRGSAQGHKFKSNRLSGRKLNGSASFYSVYLNTDLSPQYAKAEAKGFALIGVSGTGSDSESGWSGRYTIRQAKIAIVSGLTTGAASRLYKINSDAGVNSPSTVEALLNSTDQSLVTGQNNMPTSALLGSDIAVGVDGTVCATDYNNTTSTTNVYLWSGSAWNSIGFGGTTGATVIAVGNSSNIWAINSSGQIYKYSGSGTTWTGPTNIYPYKGARYLAASSDGAIWFIDQNGNLKFRSSAGVISDFAGGSGLDLIRVSAAGTSSKFKLVAVDRDGWFYWADNINSTLTRENFKYVTEASVAANGLCAIVFAPNYSSSYESPNGSGRCYIGWLKGTMPKSWPYKISG